MKNLYHKILKALNINGRDWAVLLLALLLAFSIWLIHNLSLKYNEYLRVPVIAHCSLPGHSEVSANRCEVIARCRATGYKVIKSSIRSGRAVDITFRPSEMRHKVGDMFYVTASDIQTYAHLIYGADVTLDYFLTDTLFFRFPYENHKVVPVVPIYSFTYRNQYMADGDIQLSPDSVVVYGEPFRLENVDAVYTGPIKYTDVSEDVRGIASLEKIKGVRLSENEIQYSMEVKRYVELKKTLPVQVVNVPSGKDLQIYPSVVEVTLKCNFPLREDPEQGLAVVADYNDFLSSLSGQCVLKLEGLSGGVIDYEISPVSVSCVIEER